METKLKIFFLLTFDALILTIATVILKTDLVILFFIFFTTLIVSFFLSLNAVNNKVREAEESFEKAKKENQEAIKMRTDFVTNVTHELKTPLTSISGYVETLQNGAIDDTNARIKFLEIISEETKRLNRLIDDILTLSYIENNQDDNNEKFAVYEEINKVIDILEPIAKIKNITIFNEIEKNYLVLGKRDKFKQMILNMVENAIKYGKKQGNIWIRNKVEKEIFLISVIDDGIGINSNEIDRITERFYRVDKSRARLVDGTGLGLSIVKHTASLFGGSLMIESKENEGSVFTVSISKNKLIK